MSSPGKLKDQVLDIVKFVDPTIWSSIQEGISSGDGEFETLIQRVTQSGEIPPNEVAEIVAGLILEAFRAFEDNPLELLLRKLDDRVLHNRFLFYSLFSLRSATYTRTQLIELLAKYANNMSAQKDHILKTGVPKLPFRESLWLDCLLGSFYPVKELYLSDCDSAQISHYYDVYGDDYFSNCVRARCETHSSSLSESDEHLFSWATPTSNDSDAETDVDFEDLANCRNLRPKLISEIEDYRPKFFELKLEMLILLPHLLVDGDPDKILSRSAILLGDSVSTDMKRAFGEYEMTTFADYNGLIQKYVQFGGHFSDKPLQELIGLVSHCAMEFQTGPSHNFRSAVNKFGLDSPLRSYFRATEIGIGKKLDVAIEEYSRQLKQGAKILGGVIPRFIAEQNLREQFTQVLGLIEMALVKWNNEPVGSGFEERFDSVPLESSSDNRIGNTIPEPGVKATTGETSRSKFLAIKTFYQVLYDGDILVPTAPQALFMKTIHSSPKSEVTWEYVKSKEPTLSNYESPSKIFRNGPNGKTLWEKIINHPSPGRKALYSFHHKPKIVLTLD